ncbi:class I SAM-dependent methyltransferase [Kitasatospora azatica]|uniref:class I SAM-dependent methyltransferase n=1 Tax=Kitasatospora azatica TaxID=58347 RepID=UPI0012FBC5F3|nr:class I SAM-dependent methyltransferase [Kitasatospora azatica]
MRELPRLLGELASADQAVSQPADQAADQAGDQPAGTVGYAAAADRLVEQYEGVTFEQVHRQVLHLLPPVPARALDLGAGTGRDAAALAARGYAVTAAEPTAALRAHGERLHPDAGVRWVADALPELSGIRAERFELVMVTAVWMHLAPAERAAAMRSVAALLAPGGTLLMTVRHGPVPAGRRMFEVPAEEILAQARAAGLREVHRDERADLHGRAGVRWTELGFVRA